VVVHRHCPVVAKRRYSVPVDVGERLARSEMGTAFGRDSTRNDWPTFGFLYFGDVPHPSGLLGQTNLATEKEVMAFPTWLAWIMIACTFYAPLFLIIILVMMFKRRRRNCCRG
jgi:hypothetical protein